MTFLNTFFSYIESTYMFVQRTIKLKKNSFSNTNLTMVANSFSLGTTGLHTLYLYLYLYVIDVHLFLSFLRLNSAGSCELENTNMGEFLVFCRHS